MRPQVVKNKNSNKITVPEAFVIEELNERERQSLDRTPLVQTSKNTGNDLPYWPPKQDEAQEGLIIIEL